MIRRPPRSTLDRSSAASDVYKRQGFILSRVFLKMATALSTAPRTFGIGALCCHQTLSVQSYSLLYKAQHFLRISTRGDATFSASSSIALKNLTRLYSETASFMSSAV